MNAKSAMRSRTEIDSEIPFETLGETTSRRSCSLCHVPIRPARDAIGVSDEWGRLWTVCRDCAKSIAVRNHVS